MKAELNFESMLLWRRPHPSMQAKSCNGNILALLKRRIYHQAMIKNRPCLSLRSMLGGLLSRPLETPAARSRMHLYGHPCLCTQHYNADQSWSFWTCSRAHLLCPPGNDTDCITSGKENDQCGASFRRSHKISLKAQRHGAGTPNYMYNSTYKYMFVGWSF